MNRNTFASSTAIGATITPGTSSFSDNCVIAYCFDNYKNTASPLDADGLSVKLVAAAAA